MSVLSIRLPARVPATLSLGVPTNSPDDPATVFRPMIMYRGFPTVLPAWAQIELPLSETYARETLAQWFSQLPLGEECPTCEYVTVAPDGTVWRVPLPEQTAVPVTYETLNANGDVGTGAEQLAHGNHLHMGVYVTPTDLGTSFVDHLLEYDHELPEDLLSKSSETLTNIVVGFSAGSSITTGYGNVFVGYQAGSNTTEGYNNTFVGLASGLVNSTGTHNTFLGFHSGYNNTVGGFNTFLGRDAGYNNQGGAGNTFVGSSAGHDNTSGNNNTCVGKSAGGGNESSHDNTLIGNYAGEDLYSGGYNVVVGSLSGSSLGDALCNVVVGYQCAKYRGESYDLLTTPTYSVYIGANARGYDNNDTNTIVIGNDAKGRGANTTTLGNTSTTNTGVFGDFEVLDDGAAVIMRSPNGSRFSLTVDDSGVLSVTPL